eukprot:SAG25_NODE_13657_length_264_cov_0.927273_1_plen_52_part_10
MVLPLVAKMKMPDSDYGHKDGVCLVCKNGTPHFSLMAPKRNAESDPKCSANI